MIDLRVLATTDLHGHILPWDEVADQAAPGRGLAQVASLIRTARAEQPQALLLDNGDFLNGSPLADFVAETGGVSRAAPHPMIAAMNQLGYDAATLGNHEFSQGLRFLQKTLLAAAFPIVSANFFRRQAGRRRSYVPRHVLLRRRLIDRAGQYHDITIGVIGFLPPQTTQWEYRHLAGRFETQDIVESARACLPRMRRAGADIIIALSHSGIGARDEQAGAENATRALAHLPGIDALVGGHTHQTYPVHASAHPAREPELGTELTLTPLVVPGHYGSHLGVIDLGLEHDGTRWRVARHLAELRAVSCRSAEGEEVRALVPTDPEVAEFALTRRADMQARAAATVGRAEMPLCSHFALIGHSAVPRLLAEAQKRHLSRALRGTAYAGLPLLAAAAPFKAGGRGGPENYTDIKPGILTARHIADLYPHPNVTVALCLTGAEVAAWLERTVSLFRQIVPGSVDAPLINPAFPAFNFDILHGVSFEVDLSQPARFNALGQETAPAARRVRGLCHAGQAVRDDQRFVVATNSYRASGGAGFVGADGAHVIYEDAVALRQVLADHVQAQKRVDVALRADWRFAPMPGTSVILHSAPTAQAPAEMPGLQAIGLQRSGFMRFRLLL